MNETVGGLIVLGVIVGFCFLCIIIITSYYKIMENREKKAFRVHKDLAKAKREFDLVNHNYCELGSQIWNIKKEIDKEVAKQKYMTKVDLVFQDKELEKLRYRLKALQEEQDKISPIGQKLWKEYIELRKKYKLRVDE